MIRVEFIGMNEVVAKFAKAPKKLRKAAELRVRRAGEHVAGAAIRSFRGSRTRARRKGRPVTAPSGWLAVDTGQYKKSIISIVRSRRRSWEAVVGPQIRTYPRLHEFGLGGMPRRPVMRRGLKAAAPKVRAELRKIPKGIV